MPDDISKLTEEIHQRIARARQEPPPKPKDPPVRPAPKDQWAWLRQALKEGDDSA
jgi:hypothetical protein